METSMQLLEWELLSGSFFIIYSALIVLKEKLST